MNAQPLADCDHGIQYDYLKECEHPDFKGRSWVKCRVCGQTEIVSIPLIDPTR